METFWHEKHYSAKELVAKVRKQIHQTKVDIDVLAFDEYNVKKIDRNKIDWNKMLERNINNKIKVIFEAMGWNNEV